MKNLYIIRPAEIGEVNPNIYGHFSEHIGGVIYDGIWVGENSTTPNIRGFRKFIIDKMKLINAPVIRWPGGCFAEIYDWRDGIGKRADRPTRINWWHNDDHRMEPNEVGTHEFVDFCRLSGAEPYFAANITSTTPLDIRDWIDYCNTPRGLTAMAKLRESNGSPEPLNVKYWGVGNETWGGGGNMTPEVYAHEFRKYAVVMDNAAPHLELIGSGANHSDNVWVREFMRVFEHSERRMNGFSLHFYCGGCGDVTNFKVDEWYQLIRQAADIETAIRKNWDVIDHYGFNDKAKLVIDEWGCWHPGGSGPSKGYNLFEQQSTMRDAMVAALTLNIFNNNADKIKMATVAQLVNNLHALFLSGGEHCITTPTYHIFDMYKHHQGGVALKTYGDTDDVIEFNNPHNGRESHVDRISHSATIKDGYLTVSAANIDAETSASFDICPVGFETETVGTMTILHNDDFHAHNTFAEPEKVKLAESAAKSLRIDMPPASVVTVRFKLK